MQHMIIQSMFTAIFFTLFDKNDATFIEGEMEVYEYHKDGCKFIKKIKWRYMIKESDIMAWRIFGGVCSRVFFQSCVLWENILYYALWV